MNIYERHRKMKREVEWAIFMRWCKIIGLIVFMIALVISMIMIGYCHV
jgi:hypothetical protein